MSVIQIGLVDKTGEIDVDLVHSAAMALNLQVTRDLPQFWPVSATVMYLPNPDNERSLGWMLVQRGYIVVAIDAYFNGERVGKGPRGARSRSAASWPAAGAWRARTAP